MPTTLDSSFISDMRHDAMFEEVFAHGYGNLIDHMINRDNEKIHLFEAGTDDEEGRTKVMDDKDLEHLLDDGDLIDQFMKK